jgi:hypothetical protein
MGGARLIDGRGRLPKPVPISPLPTGGDQGGQASLGIRPYQEGLPRVAEDECTRTAATGCRTRRRSSASTPQGKGIRRSQELRLGLNNGNAMASCQDCGQHQMLITFRDLVGLGLPRPLFATPERNSLDPEYDPGYDIEGGANVEVPLGIGEEPLEPGPYDQ